MKVVLAYSGGLDTSCILTWLQEKYQAEVITFCANVGQDEELDGLHEKAKACGAVKSYIEDLTEEFARDFIFPMFQANAIYENMYLLGTSIARPLIAKRLVEIAQAEGAEFICHGATG
ncbi:MAG: argininosuccinate synthase, partial [Oligosphaeraceae bacterium]|nr:argininosuccinate synthase [Oligosphaeraceae bacterium]